MSLKSSTSNSPLENQLNPQTQIFTDQIIKDCRYFQRSIGKHISMTKICHTWCFTIKSIQNYVQLIDSKISGKKKIVANGETVLPPRV